MCLIWQGYGSKPQYEGPAPEMWSSEICTSSTILSILNMQVHNAILTSHSKCSLCRSTALNMNSLHVYQMERLGWALPMYLRWKMWVCPARSGGTIRIHIFLSAVRDPQSRTVRTPFKSYILMYMRRPANLH